MAVVDNEVDIKLRIYGGFVIKTRKGGGQYQVYEVGFTYWKRNVPLSVGYLRYLCIEGIRDMGWDVPTLYAVWFKEKGKSWMTGKRKIETDDDVKGLLDAKHRDGYLELFCTVSDEPTPTVDPLSIVAEDNNPTSIPEQSTLNDSDHVSRQTVTGSNPTQTQPTQTNEGSTSPQTHVSTQTDTGSKPTQIEPFQTPPTSLLTKTQKTAHEPTKLALRRSPRVSKVPEIEPSLTKLRRSPRFCTAVDKGKGKVGETVDDVAVRLQKGVGEGSGKIKAKRALKLGEEEESGSGSSSSDDSDLDIEWEPGEEEAHSDDEVWPRQTGEGILSTVEQSLQLGGETSQDVGVEKEAVKQLSKDIGWEEVDVHDEGSESDELRSLHGSDEEEDESPWFHAETDFKKPVELVKKLRFPNSTILRKALRIHAIENRYEYYYLHNGGKRITIFCKRRCKCQWISKRSKLAGCCNCSGRVKKCRFKVSARRLFNSEAWQIVDFRPKHMCMRSKMNSMVNAEYLAERYVQEWRHNPSWDLKSFRDRVLSDLGITVKYSKAWLARARAKLMIYGSASEQYARVWDYGNAVIKYSPGSGVCIVVDVNDSRPEPPLFMRMYICLQPLRSGFIKGCRPLIGLDGCHLKGAYPGQVLVAVGKDGNNNIYPIAWATVEVENKDTWCWFLGCLKKDLADVCEGAGYTFMSDRQKGLLEALELQVSFAEKRFCVRHIWANFKLQFSGSTFLDLFWNAARATTLADFEVAMESIHFLFEDAYVYLDNIPAKHWSRHAFSSDCKSNMLLNNVCETFNAVIRDARDKPILTQMEWLRRYMMKRHNEKWEAAKKMDGKLMPYVTKLFERIERATRHCIVQVSRDDSYEVELNGDTVLVDLGNMTCTCYHWQLIGIPCVHGYACILDKRVDPEDFVHEYYTRQKYMHAYEEPVKPMPGPNHWEKQHHLQQPLPPAVRVMPGRPKAKKRKLERGEGKSSANQTKKQKRQNRCVKCGKLGHYAKTCKNEPMQAPTVPPQPNIPCKPVLHNAWMKEQRRKKEARAAMKSGGTPGPRSIANKSFPQERASQQIVPSTQPSQQPVPGTQASQASTTTTAAKGSTTKQGKGKRKKS